MNSEHKTSEIPHPSPVPSPALKSRLWQIQKSYHRKQRLREAAVWALSLAVLIALGWMLLSGALR